MCAYLRGAPTAGMGELSRIGEMILNPCIGPRSNSALFKPQSVELVVAQGGDADR